MPYPVNHKRTGKGSLQETPKEKENRWRGCRERNLSKVASLPPQASMCCDGTEHPLAYAWPAAGNSASESSVHQILWLYTPARCRSYRERSIYRFRCSFCCLFPHLDGALPNTVKRNMKMNIGGASAQDTRCYPLELVCVPVAGPHGHIEPEGEEAKVPRHASSCVKETGENSAPQRQRRKKSYAILGAFPIFLKIESCFFLYT